ncbi:MAG: hypothetical protein Fur006_06010 [Coleofasciculaceae cyanobacterium]
MERLRPTFKQRLSYLTCAIALVWSLSLYRSSFGTTPLSAAQSHWEAIAKANPELLASRYSDRAILERSYAVSDVDKVYQGQSIYDAWREFFQQYQILDFRAIELKQQARSVEAEIKITAKSSRGPIVILSMSYQVQFDRNGKIIKEVWQAGPEVSV